jgi:hypothetical protein
MKCFFIHYPGMFYASEEYAKNKKQALAQYRARWNLTRMPRGICIWEK